MKNLIARVDRIVRKHRRHKNPYFSCIEGMKFYFSPEVFNPTYGKIGLPMLKFIRTIKMRRNDFCLDMGCGCGLFAIQLASNCRKVIAIDNDKYAIKYARFNVKLNNLTDKIEVRKGDLFSTIRKKEKFDIIIANLPFVDESNARFSKKQSLEKALIDFGDKIIPNFLIEAPFYLKKNGRVFFSFGNAGNMGIFDILTKALYRRKLMVERQTKNHKYFVFELRPR